MGPLSSTDDQPGIGVSTTVGRLFWRAVGRTRTVQVVRERERERGAVWYPMDGRWQVSLVRFQLRDQVSALSELPSQPHCQCTVQWAGGLSISIRGDSRGM